MSKMKLPENDPEHNSASLTYAQLAGQEPSPCQKLCPYCGRPIREEESVCADCAAKYRYRRRHSGWLFLAAAAVLLALAAVLVWQIVRGSGGFHAVQTENPALQNTVWVIQPEAVPHSVQTAVPQGTLLPVIVK